MRYSLLILFAGGCTAVWVCSEEEIEDGVSCCTTDARCRADFGEEFPYCVDPGRHTGVCSECARDEHCQRDQHCDFGRRRDFGRGNFGVCVDD